MKNLLLTLLFVSLSTTAIAQESPSPSPSASASPGVLRYLVCSNKLATLTFGICGIRGCPATIKAGTKNTNYVFNRKRNSDGSLSYTPRSGSRPTCTVSISPLSRGLRTVVSASCSKPLKGAKCTFIDG